MKHSKRRSGIIDSQSREYQTAMLAAWRMGFDKGVTDERDAAGVGECDPANDHSRFGLLGYCATITGLSGAREAYSDGYGYGRAFVRNEREADAPF